jgi:hypothetical protein
LTVVMTVAGTVLALMLVTSAAEFAGTLRVVKRVLDRTSAGSKEEPR